MEFVKLTSFQDENFVHDISFDFYGKRFATCSTDGRIKIWDLNEDDGTWNFIEISEAHNGCIWRLSWSHPEFGNLIASCSEDTNVHIWEEQVAVSKSKTENREKWLRRVQLTDSKKPVNDVKFAPRHLGLKLAAGSSDGYVRIYEATDVFSLHYWQLQYSFQVEDTTVSDGTTVHHPNAPDSSSTTNMKPRHSEHGITCLAWSDCVFEPAKIAVGGYSKRAAIWTFDDNPAGGAGSWVEECELDPESISGGIISDIAWAPAMGRSYHLIATASRDKFFKVHTIKRNDNGSLEYISTHVENVSSPIWRVAWNATGTVLSTTSESGSLWLWRKDFSGKWRAVQELPSDAEQQSINFYGNP